MIRVSPRPSFDKVVKVDISSSFVVRKNSIGQRKSLYFWLIICFTMGCSASKNVCKSDPENVNNDEDYTFSSSFIKVSTFPNMKQNKKSSISIEYDILISFTNFYFSASIKLI